MLRMQCSAVRAHTRARVCDAAAGSCRSLDDEAASWRLLPQPVHSGEPHVWFAAAVLSAAAGRAQTLRIGRRTHRRLRGGRAAQPAVKPQRRNLKRAAQPHRDCAARRKLAIPSESPHGGGAIGLRRHRKFNRLPNGLYARGIDGPGLSLFVSCGTNGFVTLL